MMLLTEESTNTVLVLGAGQLGMPVLRAMSKKTQKSIDKNQRITQRGSQSRSFWFTKSEA